jgi:hypothetical protein
MVLLFLPYYEPQPETQFCRDCASDGLRISDSAKNQSKGYWARVLIEGLAARRNLRLDGPLQSQIIDAVQKKGFFSMAIKQLVHYAGLECTPEARKALVQAGPAAAAVLGDVWRLSTGGAACHPTAWAFFRFLKKRNPPDGVTDDGHAEVPMTLVLVAGRDDR